ncbi:MAG: hypothetical protein S4CHLAM6_00350 [Chlamydiae bacterium]|nr:hypothetical protein [Chlamydiota bacterium]
MFAAFIKKSILFFVFAGAISSVALTAEILQVDSLKVLGEQVKDLASDTLVVFDVDEVLFTDQDAVLRPIGDSLKAQIFNERYASSQSKNERELVTYILSLPLKMAKRKLVEENVPTIISNLQSRGIKVIALTSCPTRPFGVIENFEDWRLTHINQFGIDFSLAFPSKKRFVLKNMTSHYAPSPVYNKGVIFAEGFSKADVLKVFLNKMKCKPSKIIFIDDMYSNLQQMESMLLDHKIVFQGYHYIKVQKDSENDLDEKIARFQFEYLFKNKKWLSDKEVAEKIYQ